MSLLFEFATGTGISTSYSKIGILLSSSFLNCSYSGNWLITPYPSENDFGLDLSFIISDSFGHPK